MKLNLDRIAIMSSSGDVTYKEMLQHVSVFGNHTKELNPKKTIIFSENRIGWIYAFFSVWQNRSIAVPVDATATVSDLEYIVKDCTPECMWVSEACEKVAREVVSRLDFDVKILIINDIEKETVNGSEIVVSTLDQTSYEDSAIALIIYTSGTTGSPKGVMLTYRNLWANKAGVCDEVNVFNGKRRTLMLLPVHHVLPLMGTVIIPILQGDGIIICETLQGPDIMEALCRGKVGIFVGVPRLWQMLYSGIMKKINASFVARTLFTICKKAKSPKLSRIVFSSVHKKMGGHLDYCVCGGAALDKEIGEGLTALGINLLEGYGMTEMAPIIAFTRPGDYICGCAGLPLPSVECKIVNGELCCKGNNLMKGYYNRPEETAQVIDSDGFLHTGDLAYLDEKGRVYLTGRTKEIIVLSNGKNVQPNEIEYKLEKYENRVKEAAVVQNGDMLMGIIVPNEAWARNLSDEEVEIALKKEVIEPYNLTVTNYKKLMSIFVYRGDLPRTKLDKLQRYKLKDIVENRSVSVKSKVEEPEEMTNEMRILKEYIEAEKKVTVHADDHLETDLAFDSLDKVGLQGFIEQTFGVDVQPEMMTTLRSVAEKVEQGKTHIDVNKMDWHEMLLANNSSLELPSTSVLYPLHAKLFKVFLKLNNRLKIVGEKNVPRKGPDIIAPNHQSFLDGGIVAAGLSSKILKNSYFFATEEHVKHPLVKSLAKRNNVIVMEKSNLKNSILKLSEVLKKGKNVIIFPEGSRSYDGEMVPFKKTFAILSKELDVPVVPVCIRGAYDVLPRGSRWIKSKKIEVEYLPPLMPEDGDTYDSVSDKVKESIQKVLKA
jgi:long-chain acyl-CoA synthetase